MWWFTIDWWKYLLRKPNQNEGGWFLDGWDDPVKRIWCRIKGHPCGMIYYNAGGLEPDTRCKNCWDEIG